MQITSVEHMHHFHGGLRLRHNKKIACQLPLTRLPLANQYVIPIDQHRGPAGKALVKPGDTVIGGQCIAENPDTAGARVHAPTSGIVSAIEPRPAAHPSGMAALSVVIEADGRDQMQTLPALGDFRALPSKDILQRLSDAGITGLGGALFPAAVKIGGARLAGVDTLILNGAECEPYIACDEMLMREQPERIIRGALILQHLVAAKQVIIAIEDQMGAVQQAFENALRSEQAEQIQIVRVTTIYPEGGERQLIQVLTGQEVPSGGLPIDLGLLVQNVATAAAVADAVLDGQPLLERVVTVTGDGITQPRNLIARIGTPLSQLVEFCGGYQGDVVRLVMGGPLMGIALKSDQAPVTKACNCILALTAADIRPVQPEMPCIKCGECARVCPAQLLPQELYWYIRSGELEEAHHLFLADCIECGCCDFICPSHIPLVDYYRYAKSELQARKLEQQQSQHARHRFEARQERLERTKQERQAARERKKQALKNAADKQARIASAVARSKARKEQSEGPD